MVAGNILLLSGFVSSKQLKSFLEESQNSSTFVTPTLQDFGWTNQRMLWIEIKMEFVVSSVIKIFQWNLLVTAFLQNDVVFCYCTLPNLVRCFNILDNKISVSSQERNFHIKRRQSRG